MPAVEHWNGRFAHVGNGVDSGSISYSYMGVPLTKYGFAVASTNAGHNGTGLDGTFAMNNPEAQLDFGYRAVHLSTAFSKIIRAGSKVYNHTAVRPSLRVNATELERITAIGDQTDPGLGNAINPDLTPFFNRGGKLLAYHGTGDSNIPYVPIHPYRFYPAHREQFYNYRLFLIPGMGHCQGDGADGFGGSIQSDDSQGGNGQSMTFDADHDAVLALMRWVENGTAPGSIIGAK
ncbi:tannase and feruloyl esterase-domain-containing protein [Rhizoctonia solani]|nr:tannase and feruloyl esterase-domain-containing protein [Rhizoctonia solani]